MISLLIAACLRFHFSRRAARLNRLLMLACACLLGLTAASPSMAQYSAFGQRVRSLAAPSRVAPVETRNFVVYADDQVLAQKVAREAERFRDELSVEWLGESLPDWQDKCPIQVTLARDAGGETSFAFVNDRTGRGVPLDWSMKIYGPPDRILDAVLPHEITHTIFATHFGRPLPRWADEGACTTVEHESERSKNHRMLISFLSASPSRGIPFNQMFTMKEYPHDILPLYAQGYSLAKFLIFQKSRRHFLDYVAKGLAYEEQLPPLMAWNQATAEFYGFKDLSDLQVSWLGWVKGGSSEDDVARYMKADSNELAGSQLVAASSNLNQNRTQQLVEDSPSQTFTRAASAKLESRNDRVVSVNADSPSWYASQMSRRASLQKQPSVESHAKGETLFR